MPTEIAPEYTFTGTDAEFAARFEHIHGNRYIARNRLMCTYCGYVDLPLAMVPSCPRCGGHRLDCVIVAIRALAQGDAGGVC